MKTLREVIDYLKRIDEISLLETFNISSEDLCDRFEDFIEDRYEQLAKECEEDESTEGS